MNTITRRDPFREMLSLRSTMDRLVDNFMINEPTIWQRPTEWNVVMDVSEDQDQFVVKASLPGINPDDLNITFTDDTLTINGEVKSEEEKEDTCYHLRERRYGTFSRSIRLPRGVKSDSIKANYEAGVLTLQLPKVEEVKPRKIEVHAKTESPMIEGSIKDIADKN